MGWAMTMPIKSWLILVFRLILSALFGYAGLIKMWDPVLFVQDVAGYHVVSGDALMLVAYVIPSLEVTCAIGLWLKPMRLAAGAVMNALLLLFLVLIVSAWVRGLDIRCGCFGGSGGSSLHYGWLLLRDLLLLAVAISVFRTDYDRAKN